LDGRYIDRRCADEQLAVAQSAHGRVALLVLAVKHLERRIGLDVLDILPLDRKGSLTVLRRERDACAGERGDLAP